MYGAETVGLGSAAAKALDAGGSPARAGVVPFASSAQEKKKNTAQRIKTPVAHPVPAEVLENLRLALAHRIGPIAGVLLSRECRHLGCSNDNFPGEQLSSLSQRLTSLVPESKQNDFNEAAREIISTYRSKKEK